MPLKPICERLRLEVQFGQPDRVEPETLAGVDLFHGFVKGLALAPPGERRKLVERAEFHDLPRSAETATSEARRHQPLCGRRG
jgi:hypothetical protein